MIYEDSATYLNVSNVPRAGATTLENLPVGAVAIQLARGTFNTAGVLYAGADPIRVVQKLPGGQIAASPYFNFNTSTITRTAYAGGVEQITFLGAPATGVVTTGIAAPTVGDTVILSVTLLHSQGIYNNTPLIKTIPYRAEAATALDLTRGLKNSFINSFKREPSPTIRCERISDGVVAVQADTATMAYLQHGSRTIGYRVATVAGGVVVDQGTQVAGDVLALPTANGRTFTVTSSAEAHVVIIGETILQVADAGDAAANAAAIVTAINTSALSGQVVASAAAAAITITYGPDFFALPPIVMSDDGAATEVNLTVTTTVGNAVRAKYIMPVAITNAATGELDMPWQGPTGYVAFREAGADQATHAGQTAAGGVTAWGLMFSGLKQPFDPVTGRYSKTRFHVASEDIAVAAVNGQNPTFGSGTWEQVSKLEVYAKFNEDGGLGVTEKYPPTKYRGQVGPGGQYDIIVINAVDNRMRPVTSGTQYGSRYNIVLAVNALEAAELAAIRTELGV